MQVRTSRPPGGAGERDNVPCLHGLSYLGQQAGVVTIERREAIPMVDHHIVTIAACIILGDCHRTGKGRTGLGWPVVTARSIPVWPLVSPVKGVAAVSKL